MPRTIAGRSRTTVAIRDKLVGRFQSAERVTERHARAQAGATDDYSNRLVKLIPAEVVSLFLALDAILASRTETSRLVAWVVFGIGLLGTFLYLRRAAKVKSWPQITASAFAFCLWAYVIGGPFAGYAWYDPIYGAIAVPVFTFFAPLLLF
jgi:hypothetical protein